MVELEKCLTCFFNLVSQLCFDKAKELAERERDASRLGPIRQLFLQLLTLSEAERSYYNLSFLSTKNKIFLRKDNSLKSMYDSLRSELHRIETATSSGDAAEFPVASLAAQLGLFLTARQQLIDLYERMYSLGVSSKHIKYEELRHRIEAIIEMHSFPLRVLAPLRKSITLSKMYTCLGPISSLFSRYFLKLVGEIEASWHKGLECETLLHCLGAQVHLETWSLLSSLMHLQAAHSRLITWEKSLQVKETWKLSFGASFLKGSALPQLYQWFWKFRCALLNKCTLYFYQTLSQQTTPQEMRNYMSSKHSTDLYLKFQNVHKKCMTTCVLLVFDPRGLQDWSGPGYQHPGRIKEVTPSQFRLMGAHPQKPSNDRISSICRALDERPSEFLVPDKVYFVFDSEEKCSYLIGSIEPRVSLIALFEGKKEDRDMFVTNNLNEFCAQVRSSRALASLKISK